MQSLGVDRGAFSRRFKSGPKPFRLRYTRQFAETVSGILAALFNCHVTAMKLATAIAGGPPLVPAKEAARLDQGSPKPRVALLFFIPDSTKNRGYGKQNLNASLTLLS